MSDETARPESAPEAPSASAPVPPSFVPPEHGPAYPVPPQPAPQAAPARSRRGTVLKAAAVLVAVAVLGTYGYVVQKDKHHDRAGDRPGATWTAPTPTATKAFGAKSGGSHYGRLSLLLLPMPDDYGPGPDVDAYGNDVELTAGQASAFVKDDADLSAKARKDVDAAVDGLHIEGAGLRTYQQHDNELIVQMTLIQMKNKRAAQAETTYFRAFTKALGIFRSGPKVAGHPQAVCELPRAVKGEKLDGMFCEATEGDLMVKMAATGTAPLDKAAAVDLLRRQLDRIKDPGESV